jgi:hypothetical protein
MQSMLSTALPPRLGQDCLGHLHRLAAPSTLYHVHPSNADRIPCFVSGYKVMFLAGSEERGVVILSGCGSDMHSQRTDGASGVASRRPCFVPIDGMHRDVCVDARGASEPYLVRVNVWAVIDEYGVVRHPTRTGDGFPGAGQEAYLFPNGIHHRTSEYAISPEIVMGLTVSGLCGGRSSQLTPITTPRTGLSGLPIVTLGGEQPVGRLWG